MKKTYLALAVAGAAFIATPAIAQDYQMEAGLTYAAVDFDSSFLEDDSAIALDFTYYLEQVSTADKPLAEAAFLGRNNNIGLGYTKVDKADVDIINLNAEFWFEDIYAAADIDRWDDGDDDGIDYAIRVGYMLDNGLLAHVTYADSDESGSKATYGLGAKYVTQLGDNFVNLEADYSNNDGDSLIAVSGDYFLTHELSIGAGLAKADVSGSKLEIDVGAKYFFLPNVSGEVAYTINNGGVKKDSAIGVRLAARF